MLSDAGAAANPCQRSLDTWLAPPGGERSPGSGRAFTALSRTSLESRFVSWQGLSGRSYVFSVYPPSDCPAFCDAVLLPVVRDRGGTRRALAALETGPFPEPVLARAAREFLSYGDGLEFHVHLLARSPAERRAILADFAAGG